MPEPRDDDHLEEDDFDREGPDPHEMDSHDEPDLDVCPHCRKLICEETEQCPHCGRYISSEEKASWALTWIVAAVLAAVLLGFVLLSAVTYPK